MNRDYGGREAYPRRDGYDIRGVPPPYDRERGYDRYDGKRDRPAPYDRGRVAGYHRDLPEDYPRYRDEPPRYKEEPPRYRYDPVRYRDEPMRYRDDMRRYRDEPPRYRDEPPRYRDEHPRARDAPRHRGDLYDPRGGPMRNYDGRGHYPEPLKSKIFIGNLDGRVSEEELTTAFSKFGPINRIDFRRSFAFVDYLKTRDAETAMREMNGKVLMGTTLKVMPHTDRTKKLETGRQPDFSAQVTVLNLDDSASWQDLKDFGRQAGEVVYASVIIREGKRYGLIEFPNTQAMKEAAIALDGKTIAQNILQVLPMAVNDYIKSKSKDGSKESPTDQDLDAAIEENGGEKKDLIYPDEQLDTVDYD
ncbi:hypothetical protein BgAZ_501800 [Babesia gibsoni]|uniref:RRM domain-containing protein n=1 Tax=Babesia gibsoni TaxID=33632 RepID=A0AAD8LLX2_BABGI|nr:hypothetical protein BgAZ_501800 [Babesia gibsoni]